MRHSGKLFSAAADREATAEDAPDSLKDSRGQKFGRDPAHRQAGRVQGEHALDRHRLDGVGLKVDMVAGEAKADRRRAKAFAAPALGPESRPGPRPDQRALVYRERIDSVAVVSEGR